MNDFISFYYVYYRIWFLIDNLGVPYVVLNFYLINTTSLPAHLFDIRGRQKKLITLYFYKNEMRSLWNAFRISKIYYCHLVFGIQENSWEPGPHKYDLWPRTPISSYGTRGWGPSWWEPWPKNPKCSSGTRDSGSLKRDLARWWIIKFEYCSKSIDTLLEK